MRHAWTDPSILRPSATPAAGPERASRRSSARAGAVSARLLVALCEPDVVLGRAADWRAVVERESGETLADAQGAILRMACENLAAAYGMADRWKG